MVPAAGLPCANALRGDSMPWLIAFRTRCVMGSAIASSMLLSRSVCPTANTSSTSLPHCWPRPARCAETGETVVRRAPSAFSSPSAEDHSKPAPETPWHRRTFRAALPWGTAVQIPSGPAAASICQDQFTDQIEHAVDFLRVHPQHVFRTATAAEMLVARRLNAGHCCNLGPGLVGLGPPLTSAARAERRKLHRCRGRRWPRPPNSFGNRHGCLFVVASVSERRKLGSGHNVSLRTGLTLRRARVGMLHWSGFAPPLFPTREPLNVVHGRGLPASGGSRASTSPIRGQLDHLTGGDGHGAMGIELRHDLIDAFALVNARAIASSRTRSRVSS